jgi:hypothetical protein
MTNRDLSIEFIQAFCDGDVQAIAPLPADEFEFEGPFYRFSSREAYIQALREDPPEPASFEVVKVFENGADVCVFYRFTKSTRSALMAQWNRFENGKIAAVTLVFDGRAFT